MKAFHKRLVWAAILLISPLGASEEGGEEVLQPYTPTKSFAGRVLGSKVRMRVQPDLGSQIVNELDGSSLLVVLGEHNDFFAVRPSEANKAYIYRTYVLDNIVEGTHVNVRLWPDVDAPILTQLNTGDRVHGEICRNNSKWLEIDLPTDVCFYVAKEYVTNVGSPDLVWNRDQRQKEVSHLLSSAYLVSQSELRKPFEEIDFTKVSASCQRVIDEYQDFPLYANKAEAILAVTEEIYVQKKASFLGDQAQAEIDQLAACEERLWSFQDELNIPLEEPTDTIEIAALDTNDIIEIAFDEDLEMNEQPLRLEYDQAAVSDKMLAWKPIEEALYHLWAMQHDDQPMHRFYKEQELDAVTLSGFVESFDRPVQNRPGDYILRSSSRPLAYLYSTHLNLDDHVGQRVTVKCVARPNHHFAFPAYFVLEAE